jgi:hypothetical protein
MWCSEARMGSFLYCLACLGPPRSCILSTLCLYFVWLFNYVLDSLLLCKILGIIVKFFPGIRTPNLPFVRSQIVFLFFLFRLSVNIENKIARSLSFSFGFAIFHAENACSRPWDQVTTPDRIQSGGFRPEIRTSDLVALG